MSFFPLRLSCFWRYQLSLLIYQSNFEKGPPKMSQQSFIHKTGVFYLSISSSAPSIISNFDPTEAPCHTTPQVRKWGCRIIEPRVDMIIGAASLCHGDFHTLLHVFWIGACSLHQSATIQLHSELSAVPIIAWHHHPYLFSWKFIIYDTSSFLPLGNWILLSC